jgi:hypothetical protein
MESEPSAFTGAAQDVPAVQQLRPAMSHWVNRDRGIPRQYRTMSALSPLATKIVRRRDWRDVLIANNAPQQTSSLFDHLVGA